jgi:hypothetical protein
MIDDSLVLLKYLYKQSLAATSISFQMLLMGKG